MSKYHAALTGSRVGAGGSPLCGSRNKDRYNVVTLPAFEWNETPAEQRCSKCAAIIRQRKALS